MSYLFPSSSINVKNFGGLFNGSADDSAAIAAARAAVSADGVIYIPPGSIINNHTVNTSPGTGTAGPVLWQLNGLRDVDGSTVSYGFGNDLVETFFQGGKYLYRTTGAANDPALLRIDQHVAYSGGTPGNVKAGLAITSSVSGSPSTYVWANQTVLTSTATGSGQHVGLSSTAVAQPTGGGANAPIWALYGECRDDTQGPSNLSGSVHGMELDVYANGGDPGNVRVNLQMQTGMNQPIGGPARVGTGTVLGSNDATPASWQANHAYALGAVVSNGGNYYYVTTAGTSAASGGPTGTGTSITDNTVVWSYVLYGKSWFGTCHKLNAGFDVAGFDASPGISLNGAPAFRLAQGQTIAFTADNTKTLQYTGSALAYNASSNTVFQVNNAGYTTFGYNGGGGVNLTLTSAASTNRGAIYQSNGVTRWYQFCESTAENTVKLATSVDQGGAGTTLTFASTTGVANGMRVWGTNIAGGTTVSSFTGTTVTLSTTTTGDVASGTNITFGTNAGSNFQVNCNSDDGSYLATPFQITRSSGLVSINNGLTVGGTTTTSGVFTLGGATIQKTNTLSAGSTYTVASTDNTVFVNTGATMAITLPASPVVGRQLIVKNITSATATITITPSAGTIDGASNTTITTAYGFTRLIYAATNLWVTC